VYERQVQVRTACGYRLSRRWRRLRLLLRLRLHLRRHSPWIEPSSKRISKRRLRKSTTILRLLEPAILRLLKATELWLLEPTTKPTKPTKLRLFKATILRLLEATKLLPESTKPAIGLCKSATIRLVGSVITRERVEERRGLEVPRIPHAVISRGERRSRGCLQPLLVVNRPTRRIG